MEHILFLTGRLAQPALERVLGALVGHARAGEREIGLQVAALMTADMAGAASRWKAPCRRASSCPGAAAAMSRRWANTSACRCSAVPKS